MGRDLDGKWKSRDLMVIGGVGIWMECGGVGIRM